MNQENTRSRNSKTPERRYMYQIPSLKPTICTYITTSTTLRHTAWIPVIVFPFPSVYVYVDFAHLRLIFCTGWMKWRVSSCPENILLLLWTGPLIVSNRYLDPGPDGVRYKSMKDLDQQEMQYLTNMLNDSLAKHSIPEEWLDSHLAPVPKPEKDHTSIKGYRIVTMQNTVGKL